jgi:hypothetical protein
VVLCLIVTTVVFYIYVSVRLSQIRVLTAEYRRKFALPSAKARTQSPYDAGAGSTKTLY